MIHKKGHTTSTIFLLGIPFVFFIFSFIFKEKEPLFVKKANSFLPEMPALYATNKKHFLGKNKGFKSFIIDNKVERELIILKEYPSKLEISSNFEIEIFPLDTSKLPKGKSSYKYIKEDKAILYKLNEKEYAFFKFEIPFFDIDKIKIKQILKKKNLKSWEETIDSPFKKIKLNNTLKNNISKSESFIYKPLLALILKENNIIYQGIHEAEKKHQFIDIKNTTEFWQAINQKKNILLKLISTESKDINYIRELFLKYNSDKINFEDLFDTQKLASFYAIKALFTNECSNGLRLNYNEATKKLEPIFTDINCTGETSKFIKKTKIENFVFLKKFTKSLNYFSQLDIKNLLLENPSLLEHIKVINHNYHNKKFSFDYLKINQLKIKKSLSQSTCIKPELISIDSDKMIVSILNTSFYPITILGLNYNSEKEISALEIKKHIKSRDKDTIEIKLPRSFENLFVSKKTKKTGFLLHKHINTLKIKYTTFGIDKIAYEDIIPYQEKEIVKDDLFRSKNKLNKNLVINNKDKVITLNKDSITIASNLIIPKGYVFKLKAGTNIDLIKGGRIISHSPLLFSGTKSKPINIFSSDRKGEGIIVISADKKSELENVIFKNLSNPSYGDWSVSGTVTFYESPVALNYITINNNASEDALNIVRTNFTLNNSLISNTQSDAFDGDFVSGVISNCTFDTLGNDAIDISGSDITIQNTKILNAGDKGLSAGEDSQMIVKNIFIKNSEIGVAGKDLSIIKIDSVNIENTKLGFTAFKKKSEFGPSKIFVDYVNMKDVEIDYLIEESSSMLLKDKQIKTSKNVKERMYGIEFGRSSLETRNTP